MADRYKAQVRVRWRNRLTRAEFEVQPGAVVSFDEGDFDLPGSRPAGALRSLDDVLARGLFVPWDPATAGDPAAMSRDELRAVAEAAGLAVGPGDTVPHNTPREVLEPLVARYLEERRGAAKGGRVKRAAPPEEAVDPHPAEAVDPEA